MRSPSLVLAGIILSLVLLPLRAQQPPKPPPLPPINPAQARLDQTISGLDGPGFALAYSPEADMLVAACERDTIQAWSKDVLLGIRAGSGSGNVLRGHQGPVVALAWTGGPVLASAGSDRRILFWSMAEGKVVNTAPADTLIRALAMSPDGKLLASTAEDGSVQLWDVAGAKPLTKLKDQADWVMALAFSGDGKQLAGADYAGNIRLWDVAGGKKILDLPLKPSPPPKEPPEPSPVHSLAFAPDGKSLAAGSGNGLIHLYNLPDGKLLRPLGGHVSAVTGLAFHPTGTVLVSASKDRTVRLWNPAAGAVFKVLEGHTAWVEGVAFLAQGTRIASVSADQTVRIWDLADPAKK